jgi:hypothetical protein
VELINWIWFAGAIASAAMLGIADAKARNIQPIEALWLALLWVTETLLAAINLVATGTSVWTGRAVQAGSDDLEIIGLAHLYSAL